MSYPDDLRFRANAARELRNSGREMGDLPEVLDATADEIIRQQAVIAELLAAAINLRNVAGRYHTEQAFKRLVAAVNSEVKPCESA